MTLAAELLAGNDDPRAVLSDLVRPARECLPPGQTRPCLRDAGFFDVPFVRAVSSARRAAW